MRLYQAKLAAGGLIAMHLSNRTIDLDPVVGRLARDAGLLARVRHDRKLSPQERRDGKSASIWAVLADEANPTSDAWTRIRAGSRRGSNLVIGSGPMTIPASSAT